MIRTFAIAMAAAAVGLGGCASVQPRESFPRVAQQIEDRTGAKPSWADDSAQERDVDRLVDRMLRYDMTADSAVQIALLSNHNVQATYESLGIAQGELVQAGLLSNPVLNAMIRFPDGVGRRPDIEISVTQNFIELLSIPLKKRAAAAVYESQQARVAGEVVTLAADVKSALYALQAQQQIGEFQRSNFAAADAARDAAQRLFNAGNLTELELANLQAWAAQAKLDLSLAEQDVQEDREKLCALLGLDTSDRIHVSARLPDLPAVDSDLRLVEDAALGQRLDLVAARNDATAAYEALRVTRQFSGIDGATATVDTEQDPGGTWITGPGVAVPVPFFDTGAARRSVAAATVRQKAQRLAALRTQIRSDVRAARSALLSSRERAEDYRTSIIPLRHKITQQTQLHFNGMLADVFQLLQAKRDEISAGRAYVESLRDYWLAHARLERVVGGRIPQAEPTTQP